MASADDAKAATSSSSRSSSSLEPQLSLDMSETDQQQLLAFLHCQHCSSMAHDAVDTLCCRTLLCASCLDQQLARTCPSCRRACSGEPNHLARRLIGCQPWRCGHCGAEATRADAADHNRQCRAQPRACPAAGCEFSGLQDDFLDHVTSAHKAQVLRKADRLFDQAAAAARQQQQQGQQQPELLSVLRGRRVYAGVFSRDPSRTHQDVTGKVYCGRPLNGPPCDCCDGHCGPNNGCNCADCMRRDLANFGVPPGQRALVNREGVIARVGPQTGRFYCGRSNMGHDPATDGFCGPNNGNNCHACRQLDRQARGRYAAIVNEWN